MKKSKIKLVLFQAPYQTESFFHSHWFENIVSKYFDIEHFDNSVNYPPNTVFVVGCNAYLDNDRRKIFLDRRVIVDALWESNTAKWAGCFHNSNSNHVIFYGNKANADDPRLRFVPNWFWYNESLWYISRGYHNYIPHRTYQKKFLMPLGTNRGWRTELIEELGSRLDDAYWSYLSQGHLLPGTRSAKRVDHRWFNPVWFDDTCFSLVVESFRDPAYAVSFLTEKTYKVMCGQHPFMIYGASGILDLVKEQGFETFDNLFDESYDQIDDFAIKRKIIIKNIDQYTKVEYDALTLKKIAHNHQRFFNQQLILEKVYKDIIEPMIDWIDDV
jgi:hypothetical protein